MSDEVDPKLVWIRAGDLADIFALPSAEFIESEGKAILRAAGAGVIRSRAVRLTIDGGQTYTDDESSLKWLLGRIASFPQGVADWKNSYFSIETNHLSEQAFGVRFAEIDFANLYSAFDFDSDEESLGKTKGSNRGRSLRTDHFAAAASIALTLRCLSAKDLDKSTGPSVGQMLAEWYAVNNLKPLSQDNLAKAGMKVLTSVRDWLESDRTRSDLSV